MRNGTNTANGSIPDNARCTRRGPWPVALLAAWAMPALLHAQQPVTVTFNLIPPYSAYVFDYADLGGQAIITLTNTSTQPLDVRLEGSFTNLANGLYVKTVPGHRGPVPISLPPLGTVVLSNQPGVMDFLDPEHVNTNASAQVEQSIVQTGQLPEGMYQFCVTAFDYNGPQMLSVENAGCVTVPIQYANPPMIVQPTNGQVLPAVLQNPVFTWTPPLGNLTGAMITYDLLVTKVFPGQDPNDALIAARTYQIGQPVLLKQGLMSTVYVRQPADLPFEAGITYAMQVTARDVNMQVGISNQGRSEMHVFSVSGGTTYGQPTPTGPVRGTPSMGLPPVIDPGIASGFSVGSLHGKLHYYWPTAGGYTAPLLGTVPGLSGGQSTSTPGSGPGLQATGAHNYQTAPVGGQQINIPGSAPQQGGGNTVEAVASGAGQAQMSVQGIPWDQIQVNLFQGNRNGYNALQQSPLAGVTVQLVQAIQLKGDVSFAPGAAGTPLLPGNILVAGSSFHDAQHDRVNLPVLATTTTGYDGSFTFNVVNLPSIDLSWHTGSVNTNGSYSGEFAGTVQCEGWRRVLMVRVGVGADAYYAQPVQYNVGIPADGDLGLFHARVRTFNMRVRVTEVHDKSLVKNNLEVLVMRRVGTRPPLVPRDELRPGDLSAPEVMVFSGSQYEVLARGISNASGEVDFQHLVRFDLLDGEGDNIYYTRVRPVDEFHTQWSVFNHTRPVPYAYLPDWTCQGTDHSYVAPACVRTSLRHHGNNAFSLLDETHPNAYKPDPTWLYNMSFVSPMLPSIAATVKNSAAGVEANMALNEPGVTWNLWRVDDQAMAFMRNVSPQKKWGLNLEGNPDDGFDMMQAILSLNGIPMYPAGMGLTGPDGRIHKTGLWANGTQNNAFSSRMFYVLTLNKTGFTPVVHAVWRQNDVNANTGDMAPLMRGYNYNVGELWMRPEGDVAVELRDENGQAVTGKAYYIEPGTGQQGVMKNSQAILTPNGIVQRVFLSVPSGAGRKIVVVPNNTDLYDRDTITVNVPATGGIMVQAVIPFKLHRLHFHIVPQDPPPFAGADPRVAGARVELMYTNAILYPAVAHPETELEAAVAGAMQNGPVDAGFPQPVHAGGPILRPVPPSGPPSGYTRHANGAGAVDFAFKSAATQFVFRIYGPDDKEYITREVTVTSTPGKHWQVVTVPLEMGRRVHGKVTLDSAAVAGAKVRYSYNNMVNEAITNAEGRYELRRVPHNVNLTFTASKSACDCVGLEYTEGQQPTANIMGHVAYQLQEVQGADPHTRIDFRLKIYGDLDFHRLNDFPIEVTSLTELGGGQVRINGWLNVPDSANTVFRMTEASSEGNQLDVVRFMSVVVGPDEHMNAMGIPLAKPIVDPMPLAVNDVAVGMFPRQGEPPYGYHALLHEPQQGLSAARVGNGERGMVQGRVKVSVASFTDNNFSLGGTGHFALMHPTEVGQLRVGTFASDATSVLPGSSAFRVGDLSGQPLEYDLHGFTATSIASGSRLYRDSLVLDTRLHTALEHVPAPQNDLNVHIGKVRLTNGQLVPIQAERNFNIPLGTFSFAGTELSMNSSGFGFKGDLHANGMTLPVTQGKLQPTSFMLGELPVDGLKLLNAVPLIVHRPAIFGFDAVRPDPAWYVAITSGDHHTAALEISGQHLDGIAADRTVPITSLWLYSNGDQEASLTQGTGSYMLHGIVSTTLQNLILSPDLLVLTAGLELSIPQFPVYTTALVYDRQDNGFGPMTLQPFPMAPLNFNGIQLAFDRPDQKARHNMAGSSASIRFEPGRMTITGVISDQDPNVFKNLAYTLVKTPQHTGLTVDRSPQQSVRLGGDQPGSRIVMTDVEGAMEVTQGEWSFFYIKGNMPPEMGFAPAADGSPQRMRFEVMGDLKVDDQQVELKDIDTPFGNINMVYDPVNHRLAGQVNVGGGVNNGPSMNGSAAIVIDRHGYYFMTGLSVQMSSPQMQGMAFVLLGDYSERTRMMDAMLLQYSLYGQRMIERKSGAMMLDMVMNLLANQPEVGVAMAMGATDGRALPNSYTGLFNGGAFNGFYLECGASIPFPILPNFSIDCSPIAQVAFGVNMGADVRVGANFGSGSYGVGFDTFLDAEMGGAASMGMFCFAGRIGVYFTIGMDGVFHGNGNWNVQASGELDLTGSFNIGGGICSVPCNDWSCLHVSVGGHVGMGLIGNFSNSGSDFRIVLGADNTSSNTHEPPPDTEN